MYEYFTSGVAVTTDFYQKYKNESQFYIIYRDGLPYSIQEDEPMEVREYAELFSYTFRQIFAALKHFPDEQQLKEIHIKFIELAIYSSDAQYCPFQLIKNLQKEINKLQNAQVFLPKLLPLYGLIHEKLAMAAASNLVFLKSLQNKFSDSDTEAMEYCYSAYKKVNTLIKELLQEQETKPKDTKIEAKILLLKELRKAFSTFSTTEMSLQDLISKVDELKEKKIFGTNLYDSRFFFRSSSAKVLDEVSTLLNDLKTTVANAAPP